VSCLDSCIVPEVFCNLAVGEMTVIRCAGGRAKYAINDLVTLNALVGINEIAIIHHTDCGLRHVTDEYMREKITLQDPLEAKKVDVDGLTITSLYKSLNDDIAWLRNHPLIKKDTKVTGLVFDIDDGSLKRVESITDLEYF
ncbi:carbonic anhydrase, partial [Fusarium oxysporum]